MGASEREKGTIPVAMDDPDALLRKIRQLEAELRDAKYKNQELERTVERARTGQPAEVADLPVTVGEFEETLRRLVQRTAMIVQSEKCVIMVRDRETGDLMARSPAFGMAEEQVKMFRVPSDAGVTGEVYTNGNPAIFLDLEADGGATRPLLESLNVRNGVSVPLVIEKHDDDNRVTDRNVLGVLHCFNKRYGGQFIEEDVRLLERLSRNAAAVIANAQAFQELVEEKSKLVHTLESLTAGLLLVNHHGRIAQMNAQARAMFGVPDNADPISKPLQEIIRNQECLEVITNKITEAHSPERGARDDDSVPPLPDEVALSDSEGEEFIYQVHAADVRDDGNSVIGTVVIFNDITAIRNVERMKTEFVSIVSHELRTPLTPMKGFVRTLLDDENEEWYAREDRREFYGIIEQNVDRLSRLINDLLNLSRIERMGAAGIEMNWEDVDILQSTEAVVDIQKGRTDKHTIIIDFEPEHIIAETDPDKIQNILQNLVSNAIKYSPNGGEVRIIGRVEEPSEQFPEGSILLGVKDQGMGIPEHALKKLGEKFYRVDNKSTRKAGGTGIGLFLVKNLAAAHHGHLWPESEGIGKGSTFWFRFPVKQPKQEEAAANAEGK
jgi:two-component system phosphate regulon sensor histidine kinase PhoR